MRSDSGAYVALASGQNQRVPIAGWIDRGLATTALGPCWSASCVPMASCSSGLKYHAAGVQAEAGHRKADLVSGGQGVGVSSCIGLAEQEWPREQEAASEPVGFFFLLGVAGKEGVAGELLDLADVVIEEDVGKLVGDVAVGAAGVIAGVADRDGPAVGQVEGGGGEGAGLELFEFFELGPVDEVVGGDDVHAEVAGQVTDAQPVVGSQAHLGSSALGEPFGLGFESSSHAVYLPPSSAGAWARSLSCMASRSSPSSREASGLKEGAARRRIWTGRGGRARLL